MAGNFMTSYMTISISKAFLHGVVSFYTSDLF